MAIEEESQSVIAYRANWSPRPTQSLMQVELLPDLFKLSEHTAVQQEVLTDAFQEWQLAQLETTSVALMLRALMVHCVRIEGTKETNGSMSGEDYDFMALQLKAEIYCTRHGVELLPLLRGKIWGCGRKKASMHC